MKGVHICAQVQECQPTLTPVTEMWHGRTVEFLTDFASVFREKTGKKRDIERQERKKEKKMNRRRRMARVKDRSSERKN